MASGDPIGIPAPCLLELAYGFRKRVAEGDARFETSLERLRTELGGDRLGTVLPLDGDAAALAGEIRAMGRTSGRKRSAGRSKAEDRVSWLLDIEIAACAWVAGYDLATANRRDFEPIAEAIAALSPGVPELRIVPQEL